MIRDLKTRKLCNLDKYLHFRNNINLRRFRLLSKFHFPKLTMVHNHIMYYLEMVVHEHKNMDNERDYKCLDWIFIAYLLHLSIINVRKLDVLRGLIVLVIPGKLYGHLWPVHDFVVVHIRTRSKSVKQEVEILTWTKGWFFISDNLQ